MIALAGVAYALFVVSTLTQKDIALKTGEGKFALASLFIPLGIVLFRSMYFYQVDSLMLAMVGMVLFLAARQVSQFPDRNAKLAVFLELLSWPLAMMVALALVDALGPAIANGLEATVFAVTYTALALDVIRRTDSRVLAAAIGVSISIAVAISFTLNVVLTPNAVSALSGSAAGVALLLWGASGRKLLPMLAGLLTLGGAALFGFDAIVQLNITSSWIDLAIFGASAIALGSILDRHGVTIKLRLARWYWVTRSEGFVDWCRSVAMARSACRCRARCRA